MLSLQELLRQTSVQPIFRNLTRKMIICLAYWETVP